jgi:hypothetical protein
MPKYWLISDRNNNGTGTGLNNNGVTDTTIALMRKILSGIDRSVLDTTGALIGAAWPPK